MPPLESLLKNVSKNRDKKNIFIKIGRSERAIAFFSAIEKLNNLFGTSFYIERNGHEFIIQGNREYGHMSLRNGVLGENLGLTLGIHELEDAGVNNTIKFIVDEKNNFIMVSLSRMKDCGCFDALGGRFREAKNKTIPYLAWSIDELTNIGAILYKFIG